MPVDDTVRGRHDGEAVRRGRHDPVPDGHGHRETAEPTTQEPSMDVVRRNDVKALVTDVAPPCVSIYLPTHRKGRDVEQDPIRLRKLVGEARTELQDVGLRRAEADALLEPATRLLDDVSFWRHQDAGLGLLLAAGRSEILRVPIAVPELVVVGERFHLHPLTALVDADERIHVLALSQQRAQLFEADRWTIRPVEVDDLPQGVDDLVADPDHQHSLQLRRATAGPSDAAFVHGHGGAKDAADDRRTQYLRAVDRALQPVLPKGARLVVAGVHNVVSEFRSLSDADVVGEIPGQSDRISPTALLEAVWDVVPPTAALRRAEASERLATHAANGRVATELGAIVDAALEGRVDTLFVLPATELDAPADVRAQVDDAVVHTIVHGGDVHLAVGGQPAAPAAILRY
jgi:hypothetical protein